MYHVCFIVDHNTEPKDNWIASGPVLISLIATMRGNTIADLYLIDLRIVHKKKTNKMGKTVKVI